MVEKVPLPSYIDDGLMIGPSFHRREHYALVSEGSIRTVARRVNDIVCIPRRIGEIILSIILMHPGRFKEALLIILFPIQVSGAVHDLYLLHRLCKALHVFIQFGNARKRSKFIPLTQWRC